MLTLRSSFFKAIVATIIASLANLNLVSTDKVPKNLHKLGAINNNFALNLLRQLKADTENIFISPLSLSMTFGMLYYGAAGNTSEELQNVLGYQNAGMTKKNVHMAFKRFLTDKLKKSANLTLNVANAILVDDTLGLSPDFKNKVQEAYFANVSSVDFQTNTLEIQNGINSWVSEQTNGKISQLLGSLDRETVFIVLNAVYFKSSWKYPFDPQKNQQREFLNNNKNSEAKLVEMMRLTKPFGVSNVSNCDALELPYLMDDVVMLIMLPKRGLKSLEQNLSHRSIVKILKKMRYRKVDVAVPKFEIEFSRGLVPELKKLGLTIFDGADFSGMIENKNVPVDDFLHKAVIEVNEFGTEAAAVTSTHATKSLIPSFIVDRPFAFAIVDKRTNFVLFLGHVISL